MFLEMGNNYEKRRFEVSDHFLTVDCKPNSRQSWLGNVYKLSFSTINEPWPLGLRLFEKFQKVLELFVGRSFKTISLYNYVGECWEWVGMVRDHR